MDDEMKYIQNRMEAGETTSERQTRNNFGI